MRKAEYEVLKKYLDGADLEEIDRPILDRWGSMGYVKFGYSIKRDTETAELTDIGRRRLRRECIYNSPIRRFFHNWYGYIVR